MYFSEEGSSVEKGNRKARKSDLKESVIDISLFVGKRIKQEDKKGEEKNDDERKRID